MKRDRKEKNEDAASTKVSSYTDTKNKDKTAYVLPDE